MYVVSRGVRIRGYLWGTMVAGVVAAILWSRIAGPFVLSPVMTCATLLGFAANPRIMRHPWTLTVWVTVASLLPFALELVGVLAPTTTIQGGSIEIRSAMFDIQGTFELVALAIGNLGFVLFVAFFMLGMNRMAAATKRDLAIQNWQLAQVIPGRG